MRVVRTSSLTLRTNPYLVAKLLILGSESKDMLDIYTDYLTSPKLLDDNLTKVPPQSPLGKGVAYMLSHWQALNHYLLDDRLEIDNNRSERSIKPFGVIVRSGVWTNKIGGVSC